MKELTVFNNIEFGEIRVLEINSEPWFVGKDVAEILGYSNTRDALLTHVDIEDKISDVAIHDGSQNRKMIVINESGLYSLILSSKLESAKRFKKWVTSEVLPSIRKHGAYMTGETLEKAITSPDFLIKLATKLKEETQRREELEGEIGRKNNRILELEPKAEYTETVLASDDLLTITQIAKDYGMAGRAFNAMLHALGIQYKQSGQWLLYSKYQDKGYTQSVTIRVPQGNGVFRTKIETKWTQRGRQFLYDFLKKNSILPTVENNKRRRRR